MSDHSADTSISSVATDPHPEPTLRRRLSPASANVSSQGMFPSADVSAATTAAGPAVAAPPVRKQNNPYMYNVLGENASPELAARTSPIPRSPSPPMNGSVTSWAGHAEEEPSLSNAHHHHHPRSTNGPVSGGVQAVPPGGDYGYESTPLAPPPPARAQYGCSPTTACAPPNLGGYMAAAYKSVFPPGHLPALEGGTDGGHSGDTTEYAPEHPHHRHASSPTEVGGEQHGYYQLPPGATSARTASSRTSPMSRGVDSMPPPPASMMMQGSKGRRNRQRRPSPMNVSTTSSISQHSPPAPRSPVMPTPSSPTDAPSSSTPTSPMMRVYRNGRPIPVPAKPTA